MIRGIFFDLYGTLFVYGDMKKAWADWLRHFHLSLREYGLKISKEEFSMVCDRFFGKEEPVLTNPNLTIFEKRIMSLCSSLEIKVDPNEISAIADLIAGKWQEEVELDPECFPVLKELKKSKQLALVSNFDHPRFVRKYISEYGLGEFFESIVISGEVGVKKPDPRVFKPALSATGLTPNEVAYVGDTEMDIEAAEAAKIMPILIRRKNNYSDENPVDFKSYANKLNQIDISKNRKEFKIISNLRELLSL